MEVRTEPGSRAVLMIEVPEEDVARAMDRAYTTLVQRVQVPGFRRGKAPRAILEKHVGPEALREEALRRLVPEQYSAAVAQARLEPISRPEIEVKDAPQGAGLHLTATVDVYPAVTLPDYRALHVAPESRPLADEDVDRALEDVRLRHGRLTSVAEPAGRGDFVLLSVTGAPEGLERLQPGKELLVEVGGGLLPAPVEAALEGARAGDERTAQLEAPAGTVAVRVTDVRRKDLPALDDAFARTVSDQPTLEALRGLLRQRLAAERTAEETRALRERVLDAVLAGTRIDLPESLVAHEIEHMVDDLRDRLRDRGLTLESYLRSRSTQGTSTQSAPTHGAPEPTLEAAEAGLRADLRPGAERRVRSRLALEAVAQQEALSVTEEEMAAETEKLAGDLQQDVAKVQAWLAEGGRREGLRETLLRRKAVTLLVDVVSGAGAASIGTAAPAQDPAAAPPGESS